MSITYDDDPKEARRQRNDFRFKFSLFAISMFLFYAGQNCDNLKQDIFFFALGVLFFIMAMHYSFDEIKHLLDRIKTKIKW